MPPKLCFKVRACNASGTWKCLLGHLVRRVFFQGPLGINVVVCLSLGCTTLSFGSGVSMPMHAFSGSGMLKLRRAQAQACQAQACSGSGMRMFKRARGQACPGTRMLRIRHGEAHACTRSGTPLPPFCIFIRHAQAWACSVKLFRCYIFRRRYGMLMQVHACSGSGLLMLRRA